MLLWLTAAFAEAPIQIAVKDPKVIEVLLVCPDRTLTAKVHGGLASFDAIVSNCSIEFRSRIAHLKEPGLYTCDADGCRAQGVAHKQISDAADRVNIVVTDQSANMFELKCPNYRERAMVETNTAVFQGVPTGTCTLYFKGGTPVKVDIEAPGSYSCDAIGQMGKCRPR